MILTSLNNYYHRLAGQLDTSGQAKVPPYGFSDEKISYVLTLTKKGELVSTKSLLSADKKPLPKLLPVPQAVKRTSGVKSNFLWDKTAYILGIESNKNKATAKEEPWLFAKKTFEACKSFHLDTLDLTEDVGLKAVALFFHTWNPEAFAASGLSPSIVDSNLIFKLDGEASYVHESNAAIKLWASLREPEEGELRAICLVTGETNTLARLHPPIKGVYGGQSSGGSIVSFNAESYTSYGKEQGDNAPVSEAAAFAYTAALNFLLRRENNQCISIGDASTVFWAEAKDAIQVVESQNLFATFLNMPTSDEGEAAQIKPLLDKIAKGRPLNEIAPDIDPATRFYVLGLAPNASRLSIRYWLENSFGEIAVNVAQHWQDLQIVPSAWRDPPSIWRLLIETSPQGKSENITPNLAGEILRSIITGQRYPRVLLTQIIQRIRADGKVTSLRVAMIKAVLQRDYRKGLFSKEIPMGLDEGCELIAYRLGRLFATLERIQESAVPSANAGIADRYYGTASSVPYSVFPRLLTGGNHHLSKIRKDKPGYAVNLKRDIAAIIDGLPVQFPKHLSIDEQGQFAIGYHHQKQSYYAKKSDEPTTEPVDTAEE
jgi:CRISPR-associated protein Csd1